MATCTLADAVHITTNASTYASGAFTPAADDLLVAAFAITGTAGPPVGCTSTGNTAAWSLVETCTFTTGANQGRIWVWIQDALCTAVSTVVTCDTTTDPGTGRNSWIWRISGMTKTGSAAMLQSAHDQSHAAGTAQAAALASAALTTNPTLLFYHDEGTSVALTVPTNWTEPSSPAAEGIFSTPASRGDSANRDSGFTGTTVTWGTASTGVYGSVLMELDASSATPYPVFHVRDRAIYPGPTDA